MNPRLRKLAFRILRLTDFLYLEVAHRLFDKFLIEHRDVVLLVRTDGIGDLTYFARYLDSVKRHFKNDELVLLCRKESAEIARMVGSIERVIEYDTKRVMHDYRYRLQIILAIRRMSPRCAVYASFHRSQLGDEFVILSGARSTVAMSGNSELMPQWILRRNNRRFTEVVEVPDHAPERVRYNLLLDQLGVNTNQREADVVLKFDSKIPDSAMNAEWAHVIKRGEYIVISPGGSIRLRRWPATDYAKLVETILHKYGIKSVLCGVGRERPLLEEIHSLSGRSSLCLVGLPLEQVVAVMAHAIGFIGNDSGLLHVAAVLNVPTVGIIGGGHFSRYFPYGSVHVVNHETDCYECNWHCVHPRPYCMTEIPPTAVLSCVEQVIFGSK